MARLNESTAPTESLDALKRRFVRQNREIARVNSIQSLRIRSLESEVSHLLSENVSLREQSISLSQELERYEAAKMLHDGVYDIKAKLDIKLAELGSLMTDLGGLPRKFGKLCEENADPTVPTHSRLSGVDLRRRATDFEYNTGPEDGRLPAILEDKCYPRKTLESQELHELMQTDQNVPDSPHIEEVTPNERDQKSNRLSPELPGGLTDVQIIDSTNTEELDNLLPPTLETRKKRKPSTIAIGRTEFDLDPGSANTNHNMKFSLKSGAKRKFIPEDEMLAPTAPEEDDDFQYTRPSHPQNPVDQFAIMHGVSSPIKKEVGKKRGSREHDSSKRKVLEPKSTNIKGTSPDQSRAPRNQKHHQHQESPCLQNGDQKAGMNRRQVDADENCLDHHRDDPVKEDKNAKPSEKNPSSSTPELSKVEASSDTLNAQSRPTRRRGAVVSYAEPNLRDKMRRPTSEFADAVMDGRSRRASNSQSYTGASDGNEEDKSGGASSKRDSDIISRGSNSHSVPEQPMNLVSQRKRKTLPANNDDTPINEHYVGAAAEMRPDCAQHRSIMCHGQEIENDHLAAPSTKSASRQTRRHSSNPRPPSQNSAGSTAEESQHSLSQIYPKCVADHTGLNLDESADGHVLEADSYMQPGTFQSDMQHTTSQEMGTKQNRRGYRVATRRKSMML